MCKERTAVINQFEKLNRVLLDASSIIYIQKTGFLGLLSQALTLVSIKEIIGETGSDQMIPLILPSPKHGTNDEKIIESAKKYAIPVVSDDKKILNALRQAGLHYFNSIMMLNFLLYKERISSSEHLHYLNKLKRIAYYGKSIYEYSETVVATINELKQYTQH